jgi:hypothetical protein
MAIGCGICLAASSARASACPVAPGQRVSLVSQELDPDVFLWDSRDRLTRYARGDYSVAMVLHHTLLIRAYSQAIVTSCRDAAIQPAFADRGAPSVDIVSVRIVAGSTRGKYGWVLSSDVRKPDGSALSAAGQRPQ